MYQKYIHPNYIQHFSQNFLAGLVTAIALLPEVTGFALIAGVPPLYAIFASALTVIVLSFFGGRPAMVSAAAGSVVLLLTNIVHNYGLSYMLLATLLAGVMQVIFGLLNVHKLIKYLPKTVMQGFVNALAVMILLAQLKQIPHQSIPAIMMIIVSIIAMYILPKWLDKLPPALIIMAISIIIAIFFKGSFENIGALASSAAVQVNIGLPNVPLNWHTLAIISPTALGIAVVGLIESLLTIPLIDAMTKSTSDSKQEALGQGLGNIITSLFGGQGGCAMIGQSVMNVQSGGRNRLSTLTSGICLLLFVFIFKDLMLLIPTAALIGIMITVSLATFDWQSIKPTKSLKLVEVLVMMLTVSCVIFTHNLAIGVFAGLIVSMILKYGFKIKIA